MHPTPLQSDRLPGVRSQLSRGRLPAAALIAAAFLVSGPRLQADGPDPIPPPADGTAADNSTVYLDRYIVTGSDTFDTTLPTRPTNSASGIESAWQDVPRSITEITPEQLENDAITSFNDFIRYSPAVNDNTGVVDNYGAPSIRGAVGDVYQDGIRTMSRQGNQHPFELNSYEAADIVAGPASVIFGPSARTSGYVDYLTKQAYLDGDHTTINTVFGEWDSGGAGYHQDFNWQIDTGGPIIPGQLAYRVSYEAENAESYYQKLYDQYQDIYATLLWRPRDGLTVDWNLEYGYFNNQGINTSAGWNRVNSDLLDNGIYLAGPATPIIKGSFSPTGYYSPVYVPGVGFNGTQFIERAAADGGAKYSAGPALSGAPTAAQAGTVVGWVLDPALLTPTKIYGYQDLLNATNPPNITKTFSTQLRVKKDFTPDSSILSTTYYQFFFNDSPLNAGFYNWLRDDTFENRTEYRQSSRFQLGAIPVVHDSNSGISFRFEQVLNFKDSDPAAIGQGGDAYDLTDSVVSRNALLGATVYPLYLGNNPVLSSKYGYLNIPTSSVPNPLDPAYSVTPGGSGSGLGTATNETWTDSLGLYSQHSLRFGDHFIWDVGARLTGVWSEIADPLVDPTSPVSVAANVRDHISALIPSATNSFSYKPNPWATLYVTYAYVQAQNGMTTGSPTWAAGNKLSAKNFHSVSELYETGAKFELIPSKLFAAVSAYHQTRDLSVLDINGNSELAKGLYRGIETSLRYQASDHFSLGANYNYLSANYLNNTVSTEPVVADDATVLQPGITLPAGDYRIQNLPRQALTFFGAYQFNSGFGIRPNITAYSSSIYNYTPTGVITIPGDYQANVSVFYGRKHWTLTIDFLNVTNQQLFAGNVPLEPFAVQGRLSYRF